MYGRLHRGFQFRVQTLPFCENFLYIEALYKLHLPVMFQNHVKQQAHLQAHLVNVQP